MSYQVSKPFVFTPIRLVEKKEELAREIEKREQLLAGTDFGRRTLDRLLARIKVLKTDEEHKAFARRIRRRDGIILSEAFLDIEEETLQHKTGIVLAYAANRDIYRILWRQFMGQPTHKSLYPILNDLFTTENEYKIIFPLDAQNVYKNVFSQDEPFQFLVEVFIRVSQPLKDTMLAWKLKWDSTIRRTLIDEVLARGLRETYLKEDPSFLISEFKLMNFNQNQIVLNRYLATLEIEEYQPVFLNWLLREYGYPTEEKQLWSGIHSENKQKVLEWLKLKQLEDFFGSTDNERFHFWKQYVSNAEKYDGFKKIQTLIMYYNNIVVVVFGKLGNATYIYDRGIFEEYFSKQVSSRNIRNESQLKDRDINIDRIIYNGNWQYRSHALIRRLLGGSLHA